MIGVGAQLVAQFSWILYVFGGFLILTAIKMAFFTAKRWIPSQNFIVRREAAVVPVTDAYHGEHFFVRRRLAAPQRPGIASSGSPLMLTPLALALVMVETTDLIFAVDSIPAIFAITADPFLVFTSNVFAILGLRSLYFALAGALHALQLHEARARGGAAVVGVKMLAHPRSRTRLGEYFNLYLLGVVLLILTVGILASVAVTRLVSREPIRQ